MKIKVDRITPLWKQLGLCKNTIVFEKEEFEIPRLKIRRHNRRSIRLTEIDIDIVSLHHCLPYPSSGYEKTEYLRAHARKILPLDAGIGIALIRNSAQIPRNWGKDEREFLGERIDFYGTIFYYEDEFNERVLTVCRNLETNEWTTVFSRLSDDDEHPLAFIRK